MINDIITWKCLRKLSPTELQDVVGAIQDGEVSYNQPGLEDTYPTNDDILEFWHKSKGEVCDEQEGSGKDEKALNKCNINHYGDKK